MGRARVAAVIALLMISAAPAAAQKTQPEFVRQGILVPGFLLAPGVDFTAAKKAGDAARDAVKDAANGREVDVVSSYDITTTMEQAGYTRRDAWVEPTIQILGQKTRADEYLLGRVESDGRGATPAQVTGTLVLTRNPRLRQPLPAASAPKLEDAAKQLGRAFVAARVQLVHLRRCENALRDGDPAAAVRHGRAGVAAHARSTLARTCLMWALRAVGTPAPEVLAVAREILAVDSMSYFGVEGAAIALDSLRRHRESAPLWLRLASLDTANVELTERVLVALHGGGSLAEGEALATRVAAERPAHLPFARHQWRFAFERASWPRAIEAGEVLLARDSLAQGDPVFYRRLATAYRAAGRPYKAMEMVARGVERFPRDGRLYALYAQYVIAESDTVLPRGLAQFPQQGELLAFHAQRLRAGGNLAGAVDAMRQAIAVDATIPDAALMLAQAEMELGRPDSALVALRNALVTGGDSARVAQFAFARGNALYRAAQATRTSTDLTLSMGFLAFADSVRPTPQTRLLVGMAALGIAQAAFTEAVALKDDARRCALAQQGSAMIPLARASLEGGRDVAAEAVEQGLAYLEQLEPYSVEAVKGLCPQ